MSSLVAWLVRLLGLHVYQPVSAIAQSGKYARFHGFRENDLAQIREFSKNNFAADVQQRDMAVRFALEAALALPQKRPHVTAQLRRRQDASQIFQQTESGSR